MNERERDIELKVGLMVLGALLVLGAFFFVLGSFSLGSGYALHVDFNFSGNLQPGAPVKLAGINVGKVEDVVLLGGELDERTGRRVQVRAELWVEDRAEEMIREDAEFFVNTTGVLGEKYIEIVPGSRELPPLGQDAYVVGVDPARTDLIVARVYEFLDAVTGVLRTNKETIRALLADSAEAIHRISRLLGEHEQEIGALLASTARLADESASLIGEVRAGIGDPAIIGRTLRRVDSVVGHTDDALTELTPRLVALTDEGNRIAGLVTSARVDDVLGAAGDARALMGSATRAVDTAGDMLADLRRGKGTAGRMLVREELYADIIEMVRDLKRNPWKLIWKQ